MLRLPPSINKLARVFFSLQEIRFKRFTFNEKSIFLKEEFSLAHRFDKTTVAMFMKNCEIY